MNFGMIRFMRKFYVVVFVLALAVHASGRESTLLDSGWRFIDRKSVV